MSGSSALAAAKRRRSKNEAIVKPNKDDFKYTQNQPTKPSLTVSESIMYLNNRLSNLEKMVQFNSFPQNKELTSDLENKLKTIENNLNELKLLIDNKDNTNLFENNCRHQRWQEQTWRRAQERRADQQR